MLESYIRPFYQFLMVNPVVKLLNKFFRFEAHIVTALSGIFGFFAACAIFFDWRMIAVGLLLFSGYLDTLDGSLAREREQTSDFGCVLDILCDRLVEFMVIVGLFAVAPVVRAWPAILMLGSVLMCITSFLVVGIFSDNRGEKSFHYSPGLIERAEAFVFFIAMILLPQWFSLLAYLFSALVFLTAFLRVSQFRKLSQLL